VINRFLITLLCTCIACVTSVAFAERTLRFAEFAPNSGTRQAIQTWLEAEVANRSTGALGMRTYYGGTLISARNVLRGVSAGIADLGTIVAAYTPAQFPSYLVTDLPLGDDDPWVGLRAAYELATTEPEIMREFEREGVVYLTNLTSTTLILACRFPVTTADDFRGLRLRANVPHDAVFRSLGAIIVSLPIPEVYQALDRELIDCSQTYWNSLVAYRHFEPAPEITELHWSQNLGYAMIMSKRTLAAMSDAHQALMRNLGEEAIDRIAKAAIEEQLRVKSIAESQPQVTIHQLSESSQQYLRAQGQVIIDAHSGDEHLVEAFGDSMRAYRATLDSEGYPWTR